MASVLRDIHVDADPDHVWAALRDFGAVHRRLARGFVVDSRLDGDARVITFASGAVAREVLVGVDEDARRLAYSVVDGLPGHSHHQASAQVIAEPAGGCRFVWITDVLPHHLASRVGDLMDLGLAAIKTTLQDG